MTTTLGLDLGPNSIGWALIDDDAHKIIGTGVRIFPEGVDKFDTAKEESRSEKRRIVRGARRQTQRRALRKRALRLALIKAELWPTDAVQQQALEERDPYELRSRALDEKLSPHEIGRVFLHLNQRRGFKSNRKKDRQDSEVKGMLGEINDLAAAIEKDPKTRTLGEYLYQKYQNLNHAQRVEDDHLRSRHTQRDMLENEFEKIFEAQATHHPNLLTDSLQYGKLGKQKYPQPPIAKQDAEQKRSNSDLNDYGIHGLIFRQRTMYWPKSVIGLCELEPKQKRCPKADRHAQRCRLVQEVNNLRYIDPDDRDEKKLTDEQRALLLGQLSQKEKMTFDQIRKALGFTEAVKFNLEKGKRPTLKGITTDWLAAKAVGKQWHQQPEDEKDAIIHLILETQHDEDTTEAKLISTYGYSQE